VGSDLKNASLLLEARGVKLDSLKTAAVAGVRKLFEDLNPTGRFNVSARLYVADGKADFGATLEFSGCSIQYREFPALVSDLCGTVEITSREIKLLNFKGETYGNPVSIEGAVTLGEKRPRIELDISAKGLVACEELLLALPESERKSINDFSPRGSADISAHVLKPAGTKKAQVDVRVEARGKVSICYREFPYRFENLSGALLVRPETIELKDITSVMGRQTVTATGRVVPSKPYPEVDIEITGRDVSIDGRLREALDESEQKTWDALQPGGTCNVNVKIAAPPGGKKASVKVDALFDGFANVTPQDFPLQISGVTGHLTVTPEKVVQLRKIRGQASGGDITLRDTDLQAGEKQAAQIDATFANVGLGRDVIEALSKAVGEDMGGLSAGGRLDGEIHLLQPEGAEDFIPTGIVNLSSGWAVHNLFPMKAEELDGVVEITPDRYCFRRLTGKVAGGRLEAWGEVRDLPDKKREVRLRIEAFDVLADEKMKEVLPKEVLATWKEFNPYGRADVAIWIDGITPPSESLKKTLKLRLLDVSGTYSEFPYPVSGVAGEVMINLDTQRVDIKELHTRRRGICLSGTVEPKGNRTTAELDIKLKSISLTKKLRDAMPGKLKTAWQDIKLAGVTSGRVRLHLDQLKGAEAAVDYDILLQPEDARIEAGFPFKNLRGKVTLRGHVTPAGKHTLEHGLIQLSEYTVNGLPVKWTSSPLKLTEESLKLDPITGRMANGTLSGELHVFFGEETDYAGRFELKEVSVQQAAEQLFGKEMPKTTGRATAWISFSGKGSDPSSLRGKGEIKLSKSNLWEVPFFSKVVKGLSFGAVPRVDFSESYAEFRIESDRLVFTEAYFHSPVMNLDKALEGTLRLDGEVDIVFKISLFSRLLSRFDPFGIIPKILSRVEGEVWAVGATGNAKDVKVEIAPLTYFRGKKAFTADDKDGAKKDKNKPFDQKDK